MVRKLAYGFALLAAVAVVFVGWPGALLRLFTQEPAVVAVGTSCLRLIALGYGFYAFGMVVVSAFNGAGDTVTPTLINLGCYWVFQIPLAWFLARRLALGPDGVFLAITLAESLLAVVGILAFRRGRWRRSTSRRWPTAASVRRSRCWSCSTRR